MLNVALIGEPRVGKSSIIKYFSKKEPAEDRRMDESQAHQLSKTMCEVNFPDKSSKLIIFNEIQSIDLSESNQEIVLDKQYDLLIFCFEHPNYLKSLCAEKAAYFAHSVPRIALYCKSDEKKLELKPEDQKELSNYGIKLFAECSSKNNDFTGLLNTVLHVLENP